MGALIKAFVLGLFGGLFQWLDRRTAEADRRKKETLDAFVKGKIEAQDAEKEIADAAKKARDEAVPDWNTLR